MKNLLYALSAALLMASCIGNNTTSNGSTCSSSCCDASGDVATNSETKAVDTKSYRVEELLTNAADLVDQEVIVVGAITHTCKHSGRRCFMIGDDQKTSLRIEAKGDIGGFNRELIGSELAVKGLLRENRLTNEYLDAWEEQVAESGGKEDGSAESCGSETANINAMREWMKKNNKEYYSLYFMDGTSFEVVE